MINIDVCELDSLEFKFEDKTKNGWRIIGDCPAGIYLEDNYLKGNVGTFFDQPLCQDNHDIELIEFGGDNWYKIGRYKHLYKKFNFKVVNEINSYDIQITLIKNGLIDRNLAIYHWLKPRYSVINGYMVSRHIWNNGKRYTIDNFNEYLKEVICQE